MKDGKAAAANDQDLHALPDIQLRTAAQQAAASLQVFFFSFFLTNLHSTAVHRRAAGRRVSPGPFFF
jgi:hypothetical protein